MLYGIVPDLRKLCFPILLILDVSLLLLIKLQSDISSILDLKRKVGS